MHSDVFNVIANTRISHSGINRNGRQYNIKPTQKHFDKFIPYKGANIQDEYRKFIEENRYKRFRYSNGQISIPRI